MKIQTKCKQCGQDFLKRKCNIKPNKNDFCSLSCSASFNNTGKQRNKAKDRICLMCNVSYKNTNKHKNLKHCSECVIDATKKIKEHYKNLTLYEYHNKTSVKNKHPSWKNSHIRALNNSWNKNLKSLPCQYCKYATHVELAHIKAISSFDEQSTIGEINDPSNILVLCCNHHWEFDNKILSLEDIPSR